MLFENLNEKQEYGLTLEDLRNVIIQTKNEIAFVLSADGLIKNLYKKVEKQTLHNEGDSSC